VDELDVVAVRELRDAREVLPPVVLAYVVLSEVVDR
jgi:hypothetical protein